MHNHTIDGRNWRAEIEGIKGIVYRIGNNSVNAHRSYKNNIVRLFFFYLQGKYELLLIMFNCQLVLQIVGNPEYMAFSPIFLVFIAHMSQTYLMFLVATYIYGFLGVAINVLGKKTKQKQIKLATWSK